MRIPAIVFNPMHLLESSTKIRRDRDWKVFTLQDEANQTAGMLARMAIYILNNAMHTANHINRNCIYNCPVHVMHKMSLIKVILFAFAAARKNKHSYAIKFKHELVLYSTS